MSFSAAIHHQGYVCFHEVDPIDYSLIQKPATATKLRQLLNEEDESTTSPNHIPITDPELLKRCKNSKRFHYDNKLQAFTTGVMHGLAGGLTYGLSDVAHRKAFPRLKEKHLPEIKKLVLKAVVDCGLTPQHVAVLDEYEGENHLNGIPDLVPEYQFWRIYMKAQNQGVDFSKKQAYEKIKHEEKKALLAVEKGRMDATGNSPTIGGVVKTFKAAKSSRVNKERAAALEAKRLQLEAELAETTAGSTRTVEERIREGAAARTDSSNMEEPDTAVSRDDSSSVGEDAVPDAPPPKVTVTTYRINADGSRSEVTTTSSTLASSSDLPPADFVPANSSQRSVGSAITTGSATAPTQERQERRHSIAQRNSRFRNFGMCLGQLTQSLNRHGKAYQEQCQTRRAVTETLCGAPMMQGSPLLAPLQPLLQKGDALSDEHSEACQEILQTVTQWEVCVLDDLNRTLKEAKAACSQLEHYERKVDSLRQQSMRADAKNQHSENAQLLRQKQSRNEEKLREALAHFEQCRDSLERCDEVLDHAWMALFPLLAQMLTADWKDADERLLSLAGLQDTLDEIIHGEIQSKGIVVTDPVVSGRVWCYLLEHGPLNLASAETTVGGEKKPLGKQAQEQPISAAAVEPEIAIPVLRPQERPIAAAAVEPEVVPSPINRPQSSSSSATSSLPPHLQHLQHVQQQQKPGEDPDSGKPSHSSSSPPPHLQQLYQQQHPGKDPGTNNNRSHLLKEAVEAVEEIHSDVESAIESIQEEEEEYKDDDDDDDDGEGCTDNTTDGGEQGIEPDLEPEPVDTDASANDEQQQEGVVCSVHDDAVSVELAPFRRGGDPPDDPPDDSDEVCSWQPRYDDDEPEVARHDEAAHDGSEAELAHVEQDGTAHENFTAAKLFWLNETRCNDAEEGGAWPEEELAADAECNAELAAAADLADSGGFDLESSEPNVDGAAEATSGFDEYVTGDDAGADAAAFDEFAVNDDFSGFDEFIGDFGTFEKFGGGDGGEGGAAEATSGFNEYVTGDDASAGAGAGAGAAAFDEFAVGDDYAGFDEFVEDYGTIEEFGGGDGGVGALGCVVRLFSD